MVCPRCGRKSKKLYHGYCSDVHERLDTGKGKEYVRLNCAVCDRPVFRKPSRVPKGGRAVCPRCSKNQGENHGAFKGARYIDPAGYVHILINNYYVIEHRYVWQRANRSSIVPWQPAHVHHINFVKNHNTPDNLLLLRDKEHLRVHMYIKIGKLKEAYQIMHKRALEQLHYPRELDRFCEKHNLELSSTKEERLIVEPLSEES